MLPALLGVAIYLMVVLIEPVKLLRYFLPIASFPLTRSPPHPLPHNPPKHLRLLLGPVMRGESDLLDAEPLEHAGLGGGCGNKGGDEGPVLVCLNGGGVTSWRSKSP